MLTMLIAVFMIGCGSGGGGTTSATSVSTLSTASAKGKAASAAISSSSGNGTSSSTNGSSGSVSALTGNFSSNGLANKITNLHNSRSNSTPPNSSLSVSYNDVDTITFTNEKYSYSGGTFTVNGNITVTSSTLGSTTTYSLVNSSLIFDLSNVSESVAVDGNTYNMRINGSLVFSLNGNMVFTGSSLSSMSFTFNVSSNSLSTSGDVTASFPTLSFAATVNTSGYSCSGNITYALDTGEIGSCSVLNDCSSCL